MILLGRETISVAVAVAISAVGCGSSDDYVAAAGPTTSAAATAGPGGSGGMPGSGGSAGGAPPVSCARETSDALAFAPNEAPFGVSHEEWGQRWFQWVVELPAATHPNVDGPCDQGQTAPAWFLGTAAPGTSTRSCTVPADEGILVVAAGKFVHPQPEVRCDPPEACDAAAAEELMQTYIQGLELQDEEVCIEVDGVAVANVRDYLFLTPMFTVQIHPDDPLVPQVGPYGANACGGMCVEGDDRHIVFFSYSAMLAPLSPGAHTVRFYRIKPDGRGLREAIYQLTVQ